MSHFPPHIKPIPNLAVLFVHYVTPFDYICESGFVTEDGEWLWHNPHHNAGGDEPLDVHVWMPMPMVPERP